MPEVSIESNYVTFVYDTVATETALRGSKVLSNDGINDLSCVIECRTYGC